MFQIRLSRIALRFNLSVAKFYASHWNVVHDLWFYIYVQFWPYTIRAVDGNSAKWIKINIWHKNYSCHRRNVNQSNSYNKKQICGLIVSLYVCVFFCSFFSHSFDLKITFFPICNVKSFNTLKWQTLALSFNNKRKNSLGKRHLNAKTHRNSLTFCRYCFCQCA